MGSLPRRQHRAARLPDVVDKERQAAQAHAGGVVDGVADGSGGAHDPELANPLHPCRVELVVDLVDCAPPASTRASAPRGRLRSLKSGNQIDMAIDQGGQFYGAVSFAECV